MKEFSKELRDMLTEFIVAEIGSKGVEGVTYALKIKNDKNAETIERYIDIRREADKCGYDSNEVFRVNEVSNGYIFDMDMKAMTQLLVKLANSACTIAGKHSDMVQSVYTEPKEIRVGEIVRLGKYIETSDKSPSGKCTVALYNRNVSGKIRYTPITDGKPSMCSIDAFIIRAHDMKTVNEKALTDSKYKIRTVSPLYILPLENGVVTELELDIK